MAKRNDFYKDILDTVDDLARECLADPETSEDVIMMYVKLRRIIEMTEEGRPFEEEPC